MRPLAALMLPVLLGLTGWATAAPTPDVLAWREQGRALFHGESRWQQAPSLASVALPAQASACARCHGASGQGGQEAGVSVPPLQAGSGERARRLVAMAESGHGPDGRALSAPMPRYRLNDDERRALVAYLSVFGTEDEPVRGVDAQRIVLGALLPDSGPRAAVGQAVLAGLRGHFEELSRSGGVYGRRVDVVALPWNGEKPTSELAAWLRERLPGTPVFALVGSFVGDLEPDVVRQLAELRMPLLANLGPSMLDGGAGAPPGWVSSLLPSVQAQLRQSVQAFDERCPSTAGAALDVRLGAVPGLQEAVRRGLAGQALHMDAQVTAVREPRPRRVLALLSASDTEALRQTLHEGDCLWTLAMFSGIGARQGAGQELLTLPSQAELPQPAGQPQSLWQGLGRLAGQLASETLSRAGRRLQPESLVQVQAALKPFEPTAGVQMELSRTRRHALPVTTLWRTP